MSITKRLEALEARASAQTIEPPDIVIVYISPDRSVFSAVRHSEGGALVPVSDDELAEIRRNAEA